MKKFKKTVATAFAFSMFFLCYYANAGTFDCNDALCEIVRNSVETSRYVTTKRASVAGRDHGRGRACFELCRIRIRLLEKILTNEMILPGDIANYVREGHIQSFADEIVKLHQSGSQDNLRHNIEELIKAYNRVQMSYSTYSPSKKAELGCAQHGKHLRTRPDRKGEYRRGGY